MTKLAPAFTLLDHNGEARTLDDYAGKWVVLYFYPKDDSPGCTLEACNFRDTREDIAALGAEIIGVSQDSTESHDHFVTKHNLNFTLLSDPGKSMLRAYRAWGPKLSGVEGVLRKTYIIGPEGTIERTFDAVIPTGHADQVVAALKELQAGNADYQLDGVPTELDGEVTP